MKEAAAVPLGGLNAWHFLRKGQVQSGQRVLINGAGGSIGTFAVQLARYFGADVTAVDSTEKVDMLRLLGADHVIDYTQEDFTQNGETYDVIFDVVGKKFVFPQSTIAQTPWTLFVSEPEAVTDGSRAMDFEEKQQDSHIWGSKRKD